MPIFRWGQAWDPFGDFERQLDRMLQGMGVAWVLVFGLGVYVG